MGSVQEADARCLGELSGVWVGNDGATYYIQQNGQKVWWVGGTTYNEGTTFVNVFFDNDQEIVYMETGQTYPWGNIGDMAK